MSYLTHSFGMPLVLVRISLSGGFSQLREPSLEFRAESLFSGSVGSFCGKFISIFRFILFGALFPRAAGSSLSRSLGIELRFLRFLPSGWFLLIGNSVRIFKWK